MEKVKEIERLVRNHASAWRHYTYKEREEVAEYIAKQIHQVTNQYQKSELWRRIYQCGDILHYISMYL